MSPKHRAKVLSTAPEYEAGVCLRGTVVYVRQALGISNSAVGRKFNANESTIYVKQGVFKHHEIRLQIDGFMTMS